jgi:hypothetical protein
LNWKIPNPAGRGGDTVMIGHGAKSIFFEQVDPVKAVTSIVAQQQNRSLRP